MTQLKRMNYSVNIYGGGDVKDIISSLRELADLLKQHQNDDLQGDGFEVNSLRMELEAE